MTSNINDYLPGSGKVIKSDNTIVNEADGYNSDGSQNVQITGVNTQSLQSFLNQTQHLNQAAITIYFGATANGTYTSAGSVDVSKYSQKSVFVNNKYNQAINVSVFSIFKDANNNSVAVVTSTSVAASTKKLFDASGYGSLGQPMLGLLVEIDSTATAPTSGSVDIIVLGGAS